MSELLTEVWEKHREVLTGFFGQACSNGSKRRKWLHPTLRSK